MKKTTVHLLTLSALFAALTAICSQIAIPIGPVPINLALFSVGLSGCVLGKKYAAFSQLCYVLLGAVGLPVFSLFRGGLGMLAGPTGGYIVGYVAAAFLVGWLTERFGYRPGTAAISMTIGFAVCYLIGTLWFVFLTRNGFGTALMTCVVPFLPGDAAKILLAALLAPRLRKRL